MKSLKLGLMVLAIATAGVIAFVFGRSDANNPTDSASTTQWKCKACGHVFLLDSGATRTALKSAPPILCEKCRQVQAYRAQTCPACRTIYFAGDVPGESGVCPRCPADPAPATSTVEEPSQGPARKRVKVI